MGLITRQELHSSLRQELDDVKDYIDATDALELGRHISNRNNPHNVTKSQIGLGDIKNTLQADFDNHVLQRNPHDTRPSDIGAVPTSRTLSSGTGLSGGGALSTNRTISLDLNYTDERYMRLRAQNRFVSSTIRPIVFERTGSNAGVASLHRGYGGIGLGIGTSDPEIHVAVDGTVGIGDYRSSRSNKMVVGGSIEAKNSVVVGTSVSSSVGAIYRRSSDDQFRVRHASGMEQVYTSKNIKYGTGRPSGGKNGDIYIQY